MGIFRVFRGKRRRNFSAVRTCWRREWDSNLEPPNKINKLGGANGNRNWFRVEPGSGISFFRVILHDVPWQ